VNNLTTPDNNCKMYDFDGGAIDVKFKVDKGKLSIDYALHGESAFTNCINMKNYPNVLKQKGYIGVTAGNPENQNVNEIDVHSIDFFNMNDEFYQHDAEEIVAE